MTITSREIFNIPREQIWTAIQGNKTVIYEDQVETVNTHKDIIFNRYCYELFKLYPNTPITSACDVRSVIGNGYFNADTHVKLLEVIFKHICEYNQLNYYHQKEPLLKAVFEVTNIIFNEIVHRVSHSVSTIDAVDFINLVESEQIKKIHANIRSNPESIDRSYKEIKSYVTNAQRRDRFVSAYRSKAINDNQANQCIGPRGFVTDLNRKVFKRPILNGFIRGMGNLYEIITESITAAKSLNANDTHIRTSEYASRRIQLLTMSVVAVDINDCGSTDYFEIYLTPSLLENMKGKYYVKEDGTLDYLRGNETHLIDKTIKIRTVFGCHAPDPKKICTCCLGKVSENFKENSNLGYTMTAFLMEKLTQAILSTKHLTHSVKKALIQLSGDANKYFYADDNNNIYLNKDLNTQGLYLILPNAKLNKLVDALNLPHTNIALDKIGELEMVGFKDTKAKNPSIESVDISYRDRMSIITKHLLLYIKSVKTEADSRGNFVIPLDKFNKSLPIFHNPLKETNIISFVNRVASMIETTKDKVFDPYEKFMNLFTAVIEQFKCNMSVIEVIVYATTTSNVYNNNYRLGRNSPHQRVVSKTLLFRNRSVSTLMVFEDQVKEILTNAPTMFSNINRSDHPTDVLFEPGPVIEKSKQ